MRASTISRICGLFLIIMSMSMLPPLFISLWVNDGEFLPFSKSLILMLLVGLVMWLPFRNSRADLRVREAFVVVVMIWCLLGVVNALPFVLGPHLGLIDAVFESISGFTTTGVTVITGLDHLPKSVLFYRQELQWLGGMGVIVLAVAILPLLGVGGMQLFRAETPGPMKDSKLTPRITETAKALWYIYVGLTVVCAVAYWVSGMSGFDAISHSLATVSTGGFSTHDASLGYFHSATIEWVACLFMLLGGINFGVHFLALHRRTLRYYFADTEVRAYLVVIAVLISLYTLVLFMQGSYSSVDVALRNSAVQVISLMTSTGFVSTNFTSWPLFLPVLLIFVTFLGGCAGSTAGGMKMVRYVVLAKEGWREIKYLVHPAGQFVIRLNGRPLNERIMAAVWAFFAMYIAVFSILLLLVMATGLDQVTAFSAVATCLNNAGPALGEVANNFADVNAFTKVVLMLAMLLGRLEIFTLLVIFTPDFWRQ